MWERLSKHFDDINRMPRSRQSIAKRPVYDGCNICTKEITSNPSSFSFSITKSMASLSGKFDILLRSSTQGQAHSEKRVFEIKNSDRNGPEGQFIMDSATMCNAGSP